MDARKRDHLWKLGLETIEFLQVPEGILASGKDELYGCIFGRDSLISDLLLIQTYRKTHDARFLEMVKKSLLYLPTLQGKRVNIESGEEPGKMIHEFRLENHEHLTKFAPQLWYLYDDGAMRIYDTVDATSLFLMAVREYFITTQDNEFLIEMLPSVRGALDWILNYGDKNGDGFIDYEFPADRKHGGLQVQSWMDSSESLFFEDSDEHAAAPRYPIAPVEAQAYTYSALSWWSDYFMIQESEYGAVLAKRARELKEKFNAAFVRETPNGVELAAAIDGNGKLVTAVRSSMGHCLWASTGGSVGTILDDKYVPKVVERLMRPDLFVPEAGIRTLSTSSRCFEVNSYHNGSIWPHDTAISALGMKEYGFESEAQEVCDALLKAYEHYETPIELFDYGVGANATFEEYRGPQGHGACRTQAWSAAGLLAILATF